MAKKKAAAEKAAAPEAAAEAPAPKAAPKVTKAQAIRDALKTYRKLMPKEIAEKLSATGLNVSANDVSIYKYQMKAKKGAGRLRRRRKLRLPAPAAGDLISIAALEAAKKLIKELGGVDKAKRAIDSLGRLVD